VDREEDLTVSWMAIDDQLHASRKFRKLRGDRWRCTGFWVTCGSWCQSELTDGFVPDYVVDDWDPDHEMADRLVEVELWTRATRDGETGYQFHDWFEYNSSAEQIKRKREDGRRRQAEWRERSRGAGGRFTPPDGGGGGQETFDIPDVAAQDANGQVTRPRIVTNASRNTLANASSDELGDASITPPPAPAPTQLKKKTCARSARETAGAAFEEWYAAYPRKKAPEAAARAYLRARRLVSHEVLMVATHRFARERRGQDARYTPYPATWLNAGSWADEAERRGPLPLMDNG
jgi:hypothetical protein